MAAGTLSAPGTDLGPCSQGCEHADCAETRAMAAESCKYCDRPIGYGVRFYRLLPGDAGGAPPRMVHALCHENAQDAARRAKGGEI